MRTLEFGYGSRTETVTLPEKNLQAVLVSNPMEHERRGEEAVRYALAHPIGSRPLRELVRPGQKIAIVTSDISRPMPTWETAPAVLEELFAAGVAREDITLVFGLGSHRHQTEAEKRHLAGDKVYDMIRCEDSEPSDCVRMGVTSRGTPVDITRRVAEADVRICLGNVEFHYFAGYSGGYKAIMPGASTPEAISRNHRMMVDEAACAGKLEGNPIREDIEEAGAICGVDFIVNVVLDERKHIVYAAAGDVTKAHRDACRYLDKMYLKPIEKRADIVLVSQGGAPKDANLYQTQKALDNAKYAVRDGGTVILIGACNEGLGSAKFEEWLVGSESAHAMVERIAVDFQLGGHKAAAIGMMLEHCRIDLVSELEPDFVRTLFLNPAESAQAALDEALAQYGPDATVIAMPFGGATLPVAPD